MANDRRDAFNFMSGIMVSLPAWTEITLRSLAARKVNRSKDCPEFLMPHEDNGKLYRSLWI